MNESGCSLLGSIRFGIHCEAVYESGEKSALNK